MKWGNREVQTVSRIDWPQANDFREVIDLQILPPAPSIDGACLRELTGDTRIPDTAQVSLRAFRAAAGNRTFYAGFCLGGAQGVSAVGIAVINRLMMEVPGATLHVVPVIHEEIAWDIVLRHLRTFTGQVILFAFSDSDVYDAGTAEISYSEHVRQFLDGGTQLRRLTAHERRRIREQKAALLDRQPPPVFYAAAGIDQEDAPWIFRLVTPSSKTIRTAVWNGRRNYAHEFPEDIIRWVGGDRIAIIQVDAPVGVNRRSSIDLTHRFAKDFDAIIHWARDTATFQSIIQSFVRLDFESVGRPDLPDGWNPDITIFAANGRRRERPPKESV